jgi:hypothetical protein
MDYPAWQHASLPDKERKDKGRKDKGRKRSDVPAYFPDHMNQQGLQQRFRHAPKQHEVRASPATARITKLSPSSSLFCAKVRVAGEQRTDKIRQLTCDARLDACDMDSNVQMGRQLWVTQVRLETAAVRAEKPR